MVDKKKQFDLRECVRALCESEEGLTDWEMNFIDDMAAFDEPFTAARQMKIEEIYNKRYLAGKHAH